MMYIKFGYNGIVVSEEMSNKNINRQIDGGFLLKL